MKVFAHRGLVGEGTPENSVAAVTAVLDAGVDGVEVDVRLARDGVPMCVHDATLARVAGDPRDVAALSSAELADIQLAGGHGVASLWDIVELVDRRACLVAELKPGDRRVAAAAADVLGRYARYGEVVVSSFSAAMLEDFKRAAPHVPTALLACPTERWTAGILAAAALGHQAAHLSATRIDDAAVAASIAGLVGIELGAWTVNDFSVAAQLRDGGFASVITDVPRLLLDAEPSAEETAA